MYIYCSGNVVERIPVSIIDSVSFVSPVAPEAPTGKVVDLGLPSGLKWASCNVGAKVPEEYGNYYAWGETEVKENYVWATYKHCNGKIIPVTKYCTNSSDGYVDNKVVLEPEDDVAIVELGNKWRMPTEAEISELFKNCTWEWTTVNDVAGCKLTGPNGNSIFMPAAGCCNGTEIKQLGERCYYWSSSLYAYFNDSAYAVMIYNSGAVYLNTATRIYGYPVRPVCE